MKILNYGSLNIDYVCTVEEMVKPGQTIDSLRYEKFPGGKGLNQSIAAARAGGCVYHGGTIGTDGLFMKELMEESGVHSDYLRVIDGFSGSTFIQVDQSGQNSIVLIGAANRQNTEEAMDKALEGFEEGDFLLLQNEINDVNYLIENAAAKGMRVALNPSPMNDKINTFSLDKVSFFIMNEDEGQRITGFEHADEILEEMKKRFPKAEVVLTLGKDGSVYSFGETRITQKAYRVKAVDTTAAGDTFTGYLLSGMTDGKPMAQCMREASVASALAVTKKGAASSIPTRAEVDAAIASGDFE